MVDSAREAEPNGTGKAGENQRITLTAKMWHAEQTSLNIPKDTEHARLIEDLRSSVSHLRGQLDEKRQEIKDLRGQMNKNQSWHENEEARLRALVDFWRNLIFNIRAALPGLTSEGDNADRVENDEDQENEEYEGDNDADGEDEGGDDADDKILDATSHDPGFEEVTTSDASDGSAWASFFDIARQPTSRQVEPRRGNEKSKAPAVQVKQGQGALRKARQALAEREGREITAPDQQKQPEAKVSIQNKGINNAPLDADQRRSKLEQALAPKAARAELQDMASANSLHGIRNVMIDETQHLPHSTNPTGASEASHNEYSNSFQAWIKDGKVPRIRQQESNDFLSKLNEAIQRDKEAAGSYHQRKTYSAQNTGQDGKSSQ